MNQHRVLRLVGPLIVAGAAACSSAGGMPVTEWVAEFDQRCVEITELSSNPDTTVAERTAASDKGLAEKRALDQPDGMREEAADLLAVIEATNDPDSSDPRTPEELDRAFLRAARALGVSQACLAGAPE